MCAFNPKRTFRLANEGTILRGCLPIGDLVVQFLPTDLIVVRAKHPFHRAPDLESCCLKLVCSGAFVPVRHRAKSKKVAKQESDDIGPIRVGGTLKTNTTPFVACTRLRAFDRGTDVMWMMLFAVTFAIAI